MDGQRGRRRSCRGQGLKMKGYKVMVSMYFPACDDCFTEEYSGVVHAKREDARQELIKAKRNDININPETDSFYIQEV